MSEDAVGWDHEEIGSDEVGDDEVGREEIGNVEIGDMMAEAGVAPPRDFAYSGGDEPNFAYPEGVHVGVDMGNVEVGADEIGAQAKAVREVVKTARDNRTPAPKLVAVPVTDPEPDDGSEEITSWFSDIAGTVGEMIGAANPFPVFTQLLQRYGAGLEKPRYVRVDTEASYQRFLTDSSPELGEFQDRLAELAGKVDDHINDPNAHEAALDIAEEFEEVEAIGAEALSATAMKQIEMWVPEHMRAVFEKNVKLWREGAFICASVMLPGCDGEVRICTSCTPVVRAVEEMERHAASANVSAGHVVGVIPAMGQVLGAATLVKELASAAPSILSRPESSRKESWICKLVPAASPALASFCRLIEMVSQGDRGAQAEWSAMESAAKKTAPFVAQAMREAKAIYDKVSKRK